MRLLHTSDWHLGRSLLRQDLSGAQATFLDHLVSVATAERVDAVLVSGDLFDRAIPPVEAVELFDDVLARLAGHGITVVVISGNHDSPARLGLNARLVAAAGVHLRTSPAQVGTPVLLPDAHGAVAVYPVPYLEPDVVREPWQLADRSHRAALGSALDRVRLDLATRPAGTRSVVLAHAWVTGGVGCDSERDLCAGGLVGGLADVPLRTFHGVTYTALGHLHGRQTLADGVRYSGSPLAYSFSEADHLKGCWLVDLDARGLTSATFVPAPVPRRLARLRGRLADLLAEPRYADAEPAWVQAVVTDPQRPADLGDRLRARFPHLLHCPWEPDQVAGAAPTSWGERIEGRTPLQITLEFLATTRGRDADDAEVELLARGLACCQQAETVA